MTDHEQLEDDLLTGLKEIYLEGFLNNKTPTVTTDPNKLEAQARKHLSERSFNYVAGGAGEKATMDANRLAFRQWKVRRLLSSSCLHSPLKSTNTNPSLNQVIPRMLRPTRVPSDLSTSLFGQKLPTPLIFAPVGVQSIFHPDKETGVASVAAELGLPFTLSTAATSTLEEVATTNGPEGIRYFQLYWPHVETLTLSLLDRAKKNGYSVLIVTLDTFTLAWRPADLDNAYIPFATGVGDQIGFSDPVFRARFAKDHDGATPESEPTTAAAEWESAIFTGASHTWDELPFLRKHWNGPIVLKGIQCVEDAHAAVKAGVQGIVVSNHGGRQVDGAVGSLEVLPEIVDAVGDQVTVLFDSGIRTGVDVLKALCLGAKGVFVGRPFVYGLAVGGKLGARDVVRGLLADLEQSLGLAGVVGGVAGCKREVLRRVGYGGDRMANL